MRLFNPQYSWGGVRLNPGVSPLFLSPKREKILVGRGIFLCGCWLENDFTSPSEGPNRLNTEECNAALATQDGLTGGHDHCG